MKGPSGPFFLVSFRTTHCKNRAVRITELTAILGPKSTFDVRVSSVLKLNHYGKVQIEPRLMDMFFHARDSHRGPETRRHKIKRNFS